MPEALRASTDLQNIGGGLGKCTQTTSGYVKKSNSHWLLTMLMNLIKESPILRKLASTAQYEDDLASLLAYIREV